MDESNSELPDSDAELAKTVAQRVKGTTRKRKPPSSLRSPMMIFKSAKKSTEASQPCSQNMKRGTFDEEKTALKKKMKYGTVQSQPWTAKMKKGSLDDKITALKKKMKPSTVESQPWTAKKNRGYTSASFDDTNTAMKNKKKTSSTRTSHLGSLQNINEGLDCNQQDMHALGPREVAAVQFIANLCKDIETSKRRVVRTEATSYTSISAKDMRAHIIPRINDEPDSKKYICNGVIDAYAGYLSLRITDNRCFRPVWNAFILSQQVQVDRVLKPETREEYRDFVTNFYDHELVFFPLQLNHRGHNHYILVVMNNKKQEFQVLDSLWNLNSYLEKIEMMRTGIERMTTLSRERSPELPNNVGTWSIQQMNNLPQQTDGTSCGLFVLKYMELWNGTRLVRDFTQDDIHIFRLKMISEIILSPTNYIQESKESVEAIAQALER